MKIQIEPTEIFSVVNGAEVRVWNGVSENGVQVFCFIAGVAVRSGDDPGALAEMFREMPLSGTKDLLRVMQ